MNFWVTIFGHKLKQDFYKGSNMSEKKKMYLGNCEELECEFFQWSGDSYMDRNTTCYCLKNNRCIDRDMVEEEQHIDCPLGKVFEVDEE